MSHSPKIQHYWNLTIRLFSLICRPLIGGRVSYLSAEKQLVYSTAPTDGAMNLLSLRPQSNTLARNSFNECFKSKYINMLHNNLKKLNTSHYVIMSMF